MKTISILILLTWSAGVGAAEEVRTVPQPRVRLDPVTRATVAVPVGEVPALAAKAATETEDSSPILMGKFVVKERATGLVEAPKQERFDGRFTPWKGGRLWLGKLGGTNAEAGFWPYLEFTKVGSSAMREGGPRLTVDLLRIKW